MVVRPIETDFAPYAPASTVVQLLQRLRERGLPDPLTQTGLEQIGVSPSMASFVLRALVFLRLSDEGGNLTEAARRLQRATRDEYPSILQEVVRNAYQAVFVATNPATDSEEAVIDAFRPYQPSNQRGKMVRLFLGLCEEANIIPTGTVRQRRLTEAGSRRERPTPSANPSGHSNASPDPPMPSPGIGKLHPGLAGLISDLPSKGPTWTKSERDRWLAAFTNGLDYAYPTKETTKEGA